MAKFLLGFGEYAWVTLDLEGIYQINTFSLKLRKKFRYIIFPGLFWEDLN